MPQAGSIPVTVIGGYLGAGKTTLVNRLLRQADGLRLAVLVNEFGELPIDADLIESREENVIDIAGGCVCCSYGSDLIAALRDLQALAPAPDHLLVEASGVALPEAIAQSVTLLARYRIDGIVVLADAETVRMHGADRYLAGTIAAQLRAADIVLLNKTDLPSPDALAETRAWLAERCVDARIVETESAAIDLSVLLGARPGRVGAGAGRAHPPHSEHSAVVLTVDGPVDPEKLAERLADSTRDLIRTKGFVEGLDGRIYGVQTVGRRRTVSVAAAPPAEVGKVVCIRYGATVEPAALADIVPACAAQRTVGDQP